MIPWNYNIYGLATDDYASGAEVNPIGTMLGTPTHDYFANNGDPLYTADYTQHLDDSVYLWHIAPGSSVGTNAAFCLGIGDTLDLQTVENVESIIPLAMQLCNTQGESFKRYPKGRMCYDYYSFLWANYVTARMFVDLNRTKFCIRPQVQCYDMQADTTPTNNLTNLVAWINASPSTRFVFGINFELYHGDATPRTTDKTNVPGTSQDGIPIFDILTDRPIPDNASGAKTDMQYDFNATQPTDIHSDWRTDKQYSPFAQAFTGLWYSGDTSTTAYNIGTNFSISVSSARTGARASDWGSRVTGKFIRYSAKEQVFDDVSYKWEMGVYYPAGGAWLENGFPLTSLSNSETLRVTSRLVITDKKGLTLGAATLAAVKHEIAFLGFYFSDTLDNCQNAVLGVANTHVYLPEFVGGITTGNYFTGDDIPGVPYANSTSVGDGNFNYVTPETVDGDEGDFSTQLQSGALSAGTVYYALSDQELKDLLRYLNTTYTPDETTLAEDFKGANPFEYITSVKYYPFCLPYSVAQSINIGPIGTGVTGYIMPYTYGNSSYSFFDMGSFTFTPRYNNFLDYSGTQINLFLPWCGTKQLDPAMWIASPGQQPITLNIKYSFDYVTGAVTAFLFRDSMLIDTADGQVGIDIPMSALATGSYQQQIAQAQIAYKQAATSTTVAWLGLVGSMIGTAVAAASGVGAPAAVAGVVGIASSAGQLIKNTYQEESVTYTLDHTSPNVGSVSAASPFNAAIFDQRPRILISRPQLQQLPTNWAESYGKSIGYACSIPTKLNNAAIKGLTVVQAPRLQGIKKVIGSQTYTPTREELDLIRQAMAEGIIL